MIVITCEHYGDDSDVTIVVDTEHLKGQGVDAAEYAKLLEDLPDGGNLHLPYGDHGLQGGYPIPEVKFPCTVHKMIDLWTT